MCLTFELRTGRRDDVSVLAVVGELDVATAPHFRRAVGGLLGGAGPRLLVDLTETDFLDSSGMGALGRALFRTRAAGGYLAAPNDAPTIVKVIARAGLADLIPLAPSVEAGLERLQ